ncbi:TIGR04086 family membrane protein [Clostridium minihomine]|uniref:TIGR04086 family membrane protein n=1 Tax=Clostridium minihomine TaxID=2045012 RepID=UPI000C77C985|nr:TIGR04086 family membrane protein [Clostridium minihomine]
MKNPKRPKSSRERTQNPVWATLRPVVFGAVAGAAICMILLLILSLILVAAKQIPQSVLQPITVLIAAVSAFFAGYIAARISKERGMVYGAGASLLLFLLVFLAGLAVTKESVSAYMLTKGLIMVLTGTIAGILSVNKKSKRK